jgi:hypothetical protein
VEQETSATDGPFLVNSLVGLESQYRKVISEKIYHIMLFAKGKVRELEDRQIFPGKSTHSYLFTQLMRAPFGAATRTPSFLSATH